MTTMTSASRMPKTPIRRPRAGVNIDPARLVEQRERRTMSRLELSERVGAQMFDAGTVERIERGEFVPSTRVLQVLHAILHGSLPVAGQVLDPSQLRGLREHQGWSQDGLAREAARYLFTRDAIAKIENGTRRPKPVTFRALCAALDCQPEDLLPRRRGAQSHPAVISVPGADDGVARQLPAPVDLTVDSPLAHLQGILLNGAWNALDQHGFTTVGEVAEADRDGALLGVRNIGNRYATNIRHVLSGAGLLLTTGGGAEDGPAGDDDDRELATVGSAGVSSSGDRAGRGVWDEEA
jgi:transcriptional regulator with XRE-family HTH domain